MAKRTEQTTAQNNRMVVNRIEAVIKPDDYKADFRSPLDYMGRPFIIMGFDTMIGNQGEYVHIEAIDIVSEESVVISTGGKLIMAALKDIQEKGGFPVVTTFGKSGSAFQFRPANVGKSTDLNGLVERYLGFDQQELPFGEQYPTQE